MWRLTRLAIFVAAIWFSHGHVEQTQQPADPALAFAQEKAESRKAGMPLTPADLKQLPIPHGRNAADYYRKAWQLMPQKARLAGSDALEDIAGRRIPTPQEVAKARKLLAERSKAVSFIHLAAALPDCAFERDWSQGASLEFREFAKFRRTARWLAAESYLQLIDGKPLEAIHTQALGFRVAQHAAHDPVLIAYLVALAIDNISLAGMENILYRIGSDTAVAGALRAAINSECKPLSLAFALRGENMFNMVNLEAIRKGGPDYLSDLSGIASGNEKRGKKHIPKPKSWDKMMDYNGAFLLRQLRRAIMVADKPYPESRPEFTAIDKQYEHPNNPMLAMSAVLVPFFTNANTARATHFARIECARTGASLLVWKANHNRFPDRLEEAVSPAPLDPFDLKPLRYRREGDGFVVYSIGEEGNFDGGSKTVKSSGRQPLFRYPRPRYLDLPARK